MGLVEMGLGSWVDQLPKGRTCALLLSLHLVLQVLENAGNFEAR